MKENGSLFYYSLGLLTSLCCVNMALAGNNHNALSFLKFSDAFKMTKSRLLSTRNSKGSINNRQEVQTDAVVADGGYTTGYFKYETFYSGCTGDRQTTYLALGQCMLDNDGTYSKLTGSISEDGTSTTVNQHFYVDSNCSTLMDISNSFTLDAACTSSTEYTTGFSAKISKPHGKSIELETYNSASACRMGGAVIQAVFVPTGCFEAYEDDDDGAVATGSFEVTCKKSSFTTETFPTIDCTGPPNIYDDDFYSIPEDGARNTTCYKVTEDPLSADPFAVTEQYTTLKCVKKSSSSDDNTCFSGSQSVLLQSGERKTIADIQIGDVVEVYNDNYFTHQLQHDQQLLEKSSTSAVTTTEKTMYKRSFSEVVALPHGPNKIDAELIIIHAAAAGAAPPPQEVAAAVATETTQEEEEEEERGGRGVTLSVTPNHLVLSGPCSTEHSKFSLTQAKYVTFGDCIITTGDSSSGSSSISSSRVNRATGTKAASPTDTVVVPQAVMVTKIETGVPSGEDGIYTIVTRDSCYLIVNGVVASPFAVSHAIPDLYYTIHRLLLPPLESKSHSYTKTSTPTVQYSSPTSHTYFRDGQRTVLSAVDAVAVKICSAALRFMSSLGSFAYTAGSQ